MINALCVDVEQWYCNEFLTKYLPKDRLDQSKESLIPVLDLLNKYKVRGTFFILGSIAEQHPELVKMIFEAGHEIASHGYSHKMLTKLSPFEFEQEIIKSIQLLESITGIRPEGFRAPSFSLCNSTKWALKILVKHDFKYDASIFPIRTNLYGMPNAPLHPYKPSLSDLTKEDPEGKIIEFPMAAIKFGISFPVTGGFYLRTLPLFFQKLAIKRINRTNPMMLYVHPWELYPFTPKIKMPLLYKIEAYHNIKSALGRFEVLIKEFEFEPVNEVLNHIFVTGK
jgi:peptidoglycan-N-acetylglucosamine deacetylase